MHQLHLSRDTPFCSRRDEKRAKTEIANYVTE